MEHCMDHAWKNAVQSSQPVRQDRPMIQTPSPIEDKTENSRTIPKPTEPLEGKPRKLKDRMTTRLEGEKERMRSPSPNPLLGIETRRTRGSSSSLVHKEIIHIFERWSEKNTGWEEKWKQTLVYPATGRNRASVDKEDILRLDEGEFLNDNLINFYMRYLQTKLETERPDLLKRVHIFSTFFFEKLTSTRGTINYDGVKNWTAKLDLFSYDYIVVPVNENAHWYLAVICNAPKLLEPAEDSQEPEAPSTDALGRPRLETRVMKTVERDMSDISLEDGSATRRSLRQRASSPLSAPLVPSSPETLVQEPPLAPSRKNDESNPRIVTMDSLGSRHGATCKALKNYLVLEAKDKKGIDLGAVPGGMKARGIPEQNNFCDCGVFVLAYMEEFLQDPDELMRKILTKETLDWTINPVQLRVKVRDLLLVLQQEQSERLAKERSEKKRLRRERLSGTSSPASVAEVKAQHDSKEGRVDKKEETEVASGSPDEPDIPLERSVTPPPRAHLNRSTIRDSQDSSSEDEAVNTVKIVPESHMEMVGTNAAEASSLRQKSMRHATPRSATKIPRSPPPSSSTLSDVTKIDDTPGSVIVLSAGSNS